MASKMAPPAHAKGNVGKAQDTAKAPADEQVGRAGTQGRGPQAVAKPEGDGIEIEGPELRVFQEKKRARTLPR